MTTSVDIDEAFIKRVYATSAFLWAFGVVVCVSFAQYYAAIGWTVGSAMSAGVLRSLEVVIRRNFVPGCPGARRALTRFSLVKLAVIIVILIAVVLASRRSFELVLGFCVGLVLTQAVIFLKVVGVLINERLNG